MAQDVLSNLSDRSKKMISMRIFNTQVNVTATFLVNFFVLLAVVTWLEMTWQLGQGFWQVFYLRFLMMLLLSVAVFGHVIGHIFSARYAKAPMDEILIPAGLPRTLYQNNAVSPDVHRLRAIGGPIFNLAGMLLSLAIYASAGSQTIASDLAAWSAIGHGSVLLFSLMPLPIVDGGSLLKWTFVAGGMGEVAADARLRRINWGMGIICGALGLVFIAMQLWIPGVILIGMAGVLIGVVTGKLS